MQILLLVISIVLIVSAMAEESTKKRKLAYSRYNTGYYPLPAGLNLVNGQCRYIVTNGDSLIKIANKFSHYLPFDKTDCLKCSGYVQQCAVPLSINYKSGHYGDWVALWTTNGACTAGNMDASKIKVGTSIIIPNCPEYQPQPSAKPTKQPVKKTTKLRGQPVETTDDTIDHIVNKVKQWIGTSAPTKRPTRVPTQPPSDDDAASSEYYA